MAVGALAPRIPNFTSTSATSQPFHWKTEDLIFSFEVQAGKLRQRRLAPVYESFNGVPAVRRYTRVANAGDSPVGIEFVSSAMLHGLAAPQAYDRELRIHVAFNSWMAEGQWRTFRPSEMGFVENERTSWRKHVREASAVGQLSDICPWLWSKTQD